MTISNVTKYHSMPLETTESQLRTQMRSNGIEPPAVLVWDSTFHRFSPNGGKGDAGWYILHEDKIPAGAYGDWHNEQIRYTFCADVGHLLTREEISESRLRIAEAMRIRDEAQRQEWADTARNCEAIWKELPAAPPNQPYLVKKGIKPHFSKVDPNGRLVVPLFDEEGKFTTIQFIPTEGRKLFQKNGRAGGSFSILGNIENKAFIVEGFATGATVYEETGTATVIAYSAGNLDAVTEIIMRKHPGCEIVVVADNDSSPEKKRNTGVEAAKALQSKYGVSIIVPPIDGDVNDYRQSGGNVQDLLMSGPTMSDKLKVIFGNELPEDYEVPDEIVENLLVSNSMTVIYGDSNSGKTFFALSVAMAVSEGVSCYGRQVDQGLVLYLATEAPASIRARTQAMKKFHKSSLSNLAMVPVPLNFHTNNSDATAVITLVEELERTKGQKVKIIIADTLARMSSGANENSGEDMGPVMERFSMVASHTKAAVVVIHHIGKDQAKGARGWSGMRAHIDTEIEVEDANGIKSARVTKQRELGSKGDEIKFKLEIIPMGISKFGKDVTTCVAIWDNDPAHQKFSLPQQKRIDWLKDMLRGLDVDPNDFPRVSREQVKRYLMTRQNMTEDNARKNMSDKDPSRFIGGLVADKAIYVQEGGFVVTFSFPEEAGRL